MQQETNTALKSNGIGAYKSHNNIDTYSVYETDHFCLDLKLQELALDIELYGKQFLKLNGIDLYEEKDRRRC